MARYALILAAACGFMISAVSGLFIVPFLHKLHFGQTIKEIGPTWHNKKQGTPTMGGLCFILGTVFAVCLALTSLLHGSPELMGGPDSRGLYLAIFSAFGFGLIGFLDDFIKVVKKRNLGLRAWQKIVGQLLVTTALLAGLWMNGTLSTSITLPFFGMVDFGILFYPLSYILIIGVVNAVNLTDGIDGLCSCVTFVSMLGFLTLVSFLGQFVMSILPAALAGALAGFLIWKLLPGQNLHGRYRQHVPGRRGCRPGLCHGPAGDFVLLRCGLYLGGGHRGDSGDLLQADPRQAHLQDDPHPPLLRDAWLERGEDRCELQRTGGPVCCAGADLCLFLLLISSLCQAAPAA